MKKSEFQPRDVLFMSGTALLALLLRIPLLRIPFERDEGEYAYIAWRLASGELPYRDWFNQKPPGIFWAYRGAFELPLDPVVAVHLIAAICVAASTLVVYQIVRPFAGSTPALLASIVFTLLSTDPWIMGTAANTEVFMNLPILLAHLVFLRSVASGNKDRRAWLLIGLLVGAATAFKQVAAVNFAFFAIAVLLGSHNQQRIAGTLRFALWAGLGGLVAWLPIAIWFYAHGALGDLWKNVFLHNFQYVSAVSPAARLQMLLHTLGRLAPSETAIWAFALVGLGILWRRGAEHRAAALYLGGWLGFGALGVSASGYYFPHYFQQLTAPLAMLAGGAASAWMAPRARFPRLRAVLVPCALLAQIVTALLPFLFAHSPEEAVRRIYPHDLFDTMPEVGDRIRSITTPEDRIYVFGAEPEIFFHAQRVSATRYIFLFPLYGPYPDAVENQRAAIQELTEAEPAALVFLPNSLFFAAGAPQLLTRWTRAQVASEFEVDSYIVLNADGRGGLVEGDSSPPPRTIIGRVFVRKEARGL